jgi:hypothetical protein
MASGLPGKRVEAHRAGIAAITSRLLPCSILWDDAKGTSFRSQG